MTLKEVKKEAKHYILEGQSKQETFEQLKKKADGSVPVDKIVRVVESIPSLQARKKYGIWNTILIALLGITVLGKVLTAFSMIENIGMAGTPFILLLPLINVLLLWGVATYTPGTYIAAAVLAGISITGLWKNAGKLHADPNHWLLLINFIIMLGIIVLGIFLHFKLFQSHRIESEQYFDEEGKVRYRSQIRIDD